MKCECTYGYCHRIVMVLSWYRHGIVMVLSWYCHVAGVPMESERIKSIISRAIFFAESKLEPR